MCTAISRVARRTGTATTLTIIATLWPPLMLASSAVDASDTRSPNGKGSLHLDISPAWTIQVTDAYSVATAGDVNGDGFSDVVVGDPSYDNGENNEGQALVFLGSAAGLATIPAWTFETNSVEAQLGTSVASAGDVNGDGYHDVIVGAPEYSNNEPVEGRAYLFLGSAAGLLASPAWRVESNQSFSYFGASVAGAGDVNGDGFSDVIVGAYGYDNGEESEGRAYVYLGSAIGPSTTPQWMTESQQALAMFGASVATAGDINGDGYSDVLVGAPSHQVGAMLRAGRVFAYLGSPAGLQFDWYTSGTHSDAQYGFSVATAGDINSDGCADVIIGAPGFSNGQNAEGRAFLYLGSSGSLGITPSWTAESNQVFAQFGRSVAPAGDVDGDSFSDVIIGSPNYDNSDNQGRVFVYFGGHPTFGPTPGWSVDGNQADAFLGYSVATAGDVNGDGFSDVIVSASGTDEAYVYHGSAASLYAVDTFRYSSSLANARFGTSVAAAGDVDGNGYSDNIVGAPGYGQDAGRAYVYNAVQPLLWTADGTQEFAQFGNSVAGAGDVNGDGFTDVIVGANLHDNGQLNEGRVFVYHSSNAGPASSPSWTAEGNQAFAEFGNCVASAGDVNGDGFGDVIIGAYAYDNGQEDEGRVFVYHGSATGLSGSPSWRVESNQAISGLGISVATAGDVNRDGFSDVIVGAYLFDNGQSNEGRAFVYHGSATGLATTPSWIAEPNQALANFGISVATAGDVNGDGFSDVIIGAASFNNGQDGEGRAFVYLGSPSGLGSSPSWTAESNQVGAQFGYSVATAGDVNGDGFSDVVIGAPFFSNGQIEEGRAFTYHGSTGGLAATPAWTAEGDQASASYGSSVATGGDLNGDGFSDVIVGSPARDAQSNTDAGFYFAYYGNWDPSGFMIMFSRHLQQARVDDTAVIPLLGKSDYQHGFRLKGGGASPAGRARVWLEWEVKPLGVPFDGQDIVTGSVFQTEPPGPFGSAVLLSERVTGLMNNTRYCWRARVASHSPFFPRTPWLVHSGNARTEADLRTTGTATGLAESAPPASFLLLEPIRPNPIGPAGEIAYSLPETGSVRLTVYDVQGRARALLDRGMKPAGRHIVRWDGRATSGAHLEAGVYFVRLEVGGRSETQKLVWTP